MKSDREKRIIAGVEIPEEPAKCTPYQRGLAVGWNEGAKFTLLAFKKLQQKTINAIKESESKDANLPSTKCN